MKKRPTKTMLNMLSLFEDDVRMCLKGKKSGYIVEHTYKVFREFGREDYLNKIVEKIEKELHPKKRKFTKAT